MNYLNYYENRRADLWNTWIPEDRTSIFQTKKGTEPIWSRPYPLPKLHEEISKKG